MDNTPTMMACEEILFELKMNSIEVLVNFQKNDLRIMKGH